MVQQHQQQQGDADKLNGEKDETISNLEARLRENKEFCAMAFEEVKKKKMKMMMIL
jgi:hypothetical protein